MAHEAITLRPQYPICEGCLWYNNAQKTLDSLIQEGTPIVSADITCIPENDVHARVEAHAYTEENDPRKQRSHPLIWNAVLYCIKKRIDTTETPEENPD